MSSRPCAGSSRSDDSSANTATATASACCTASPPTAGGECAKAWPWPSSARPTTTPNGAFTIAEQWATDPNPLVRRAAVAAVCEPRLLGNPAFAQRALVLVDAVTADLARSPLATRRETAVRTLRQALGYAWSVAIAAVPDDGLAAFARLEADDDPDIAWIVRENRKKARLKRLLD